MNVNIVAAWCPMRKVAYASRLDVLRAMKGKKANRGSLGKSYRCEHCGHWHLGHAKPLDRKRRAMLRGRLA